MGKEELSQQLVDENDIFEWAEQVGPMFGSILPSFLHVIFFPNKPTPPSRTSFDFPQISQESSVFKFGSSPLLFSFGCMSPALGGEVRILLGCTVFRCWGWGCNRSVGIYSLYLLLVSAFVCIVLQAVYVCIGWAFIQSIAKCASRIWRTHSAHHPKWRIDLWSLYRFTMERIERFLRQS
jgi:hypothetical protein